MKDARDALILALRHAKTCRTTRAHRPGVGHVYLRERPWHAQWMIALGNAVLDDLGVRVHFLGDGAWRRWERDVYRALGVAGVRDERGMLVVPAFQGVVLADYLARPDVNDQEKRRAAEVSVRALRVAHRTTLPWPDDVVRTFSHGDATVRNIVYDGENGAAQWIDFESLHDPAWDATSRRADDLRAWLVSAWESWPNVEVLTEAIIAAYGDASAVTALIDALGRRDDNLYHLAQGRMDAARRAAAAQSLLRRLR